MSEPHASPLSPPMPFGQLLDEAMKQTRRHFRQIYPPVAIPLALVALGMGVIQAINLQNLSTLSTGNPFALSLDTVALAFVALILMSIGFMALQVAAVEAAAGRPVDLRRAWSFACQPAVLGTLLLQGLAILASVIACLLPVLYVFPLFAFTGVVMAAENLFGTRALGRSAELTRYNPRRQFVETPMVKILAVMVLSIVISWLVSLLVVLPFQASMFVDIFRQAAGGETEPLRGMAQWGWIQLIPQLLQSLISTAVYLYLSFCFALLFFDTRKEGTDLTAAVDAVFQPPAPPPFGGSRP